MGAKSKHKEEVWSRAWEQNSNKRKRLVGALGGKIKIKRRRLGGALGNEIKIKEKGLEARLGVKIK